MNELETIAQERAVPDVEALRQAVKLLARNHGEIVNRQDTANELRQCHWDGQSADGRKHSEDLDEEPFPFEGATDSRVRMADTVIRERKALLLEAVMKSMPLVGAVEAGDTELASRISSLMRWLRDSKLRTMLWREVQLAAEYYCADDPAVAIVGVFWEQRAALAMRTITMQETVAYYVQTNPQFVERMQMLQRVSTQRDVTEEAQALMAHAMVEVQVLLAIGGDEAEAFLAGWLPNVRAESLGKLAADLAKEGTARAPESYLRVNQPRWISYRLFEDIFPPVNECDPERWPYVFVRSILTRTEVEGRALAEDWSKAFTDSVLAAVNVSLVPDANGGMLRARLRRTDAVDVASGATASAVGTSGTEYEELFEVWESYARASDDEGVEGIWRTVFGANATAKGSTEVYGSHELLDYEHGEMPFVPIQAEMMSRNMLDSRGVPALIGTHQTEVKIQRDTRGDNAMLVTGPMFKVNMRRGGLKLTVGPFVQLSVMKSDDIEKMDAGTAYPNASMEMEAAVKDEVNELLGRRHPKADPARVAREEAMTVALFMEGIGHAWVQTIKLCQQFMPPVEIARVTGGKNVWQRLTREEIQGQFDLQFYLDVRDSNMDFLKIKVEYLMRMAEMDTDGVINRAKLIEFGARAVDAALADIVIEEPRSASARERKEEQQAVIMMANGIEPEFEQLGANAQLRLQVLQETIQMSPQLAQRMQGGEDGQDLFPALVQNRVKNLTFLVEQQQNKQTGRVGAKKVTG